MKKSYSCEQSTLAELLLGLVKEKQRYSLICDAAIVTYMWLTTSISFLSLSTCRCCFCLFGCVLHLLLFCVMLVLIWVCVLEQVNGQIYSTKKSTSYLAWLPSPSIHKQVNNTKSTYNEEIYSAKTNEASRMHPDECGITVSGNSQVQTT